MAVLSGYRASERDRPQTAILGQWLWWVSEDIDDVRRIDGALKACNDAIRHFVGTHYEADAIVAAQ
jgi:hypothetical protein